MKRDPRLRRLGERRSPRRLHGYRADPVGLLLRLSADTRAFVAALDRAALAAMDLRRDLELRGEAYVKVGWDRELDQPTAIRIEPSEIQPSPPPRTGRLHGGPGTRPSAFVDRMTRPVPRVPYATYPPEHGLGPFAVSGEIYCKLGEAEYDALIEGVLGDVSIDESA